MLRKSLSVVSLVLLLALFLVACRRGGEVAELTPVVGGTATAIVPPATTATITAAATPTNTATPLADVSATATAIPASATATAQPPTAQPPTATTAPLPPPPTATATVNAGPPPGGSARIVFGPGATSAVVQSSLAAGGDGDTWLLRVAAGQTITVQTIATSPGQIVVSLLNMTGGTLATNADTTALSATVPATGDYQINLATASGAPAVAYTMQVFVPAGGGQVTPTRITFAPGQSSAQLTDSLATGGDLNSYVLTVAAGQTIQVAVFASPPAATNIAIRDAAGQLLSTGTDMSGASATAATAGDVFIDVSNANAAPAVSYTLTVTVPPTQPPPAQATRVSFGPGQFSAQLDGALAAGQTALYVLNAAAGQTLLAGLTENPPGNVEIAVLDAAGNTLNFGRGPTSLGTLLPSGGDVYVRLYSSLAAGYSLTVTLPPLPQANATRISFAPGATAGTVSGDLPFGGDVDTYVIGGQAGQVLTVTAAAAEATGWLRLFVYNAAGQLIALGTDVTGAAAPLATAGDTRIVLVSDPAASPLSYTLTATIP